MDTVVFQLVRGLLMLSNNHEKDLISQLETRKDSTESQ